MLTISAATLYRMQILYVILNSYIEYVPIPKFLLIPILIFRFLPIPTPEINRVPIPILDFKSMYDIIQL